MTVVAVLAGCRGDAAAMRTILRQADAEAVDAVWLAGDIAGEGLDPLGCIRLSRRVARVAVAGPFEALLCGARHYGRPRTRVARADETYARLSDPERGWLHRLPLVADLGVAEVRHGTPFNALAGTVDHARAATDTLRAQRAPLGVHGGAPRQTCWELGPDGAALERDTADPVPFAPGRFILSPGVAATDPDGLAHWMTLDFDDRAATWRQTPVDARAAGRRP